MSTFKLNANHDNESIIANIGRTIRDLDSSKTWQIEIKPYRKNRSLEQNSYYFGVMLTTIAKWYHESRGIPVDEEALHEELKPLYCPYTIKFSSTGEQKIYKSTAKLTTKEFTEMSDKIIADFACMGCDIPPPDRERVAA